MNRRWIVVALLAAASVGWFARAGIADEEPPAEDPMQAMIEIGQPGKMHALLKMMEGDFIVAAKSPTPDGVVESSGTVSGKMVLGGRFLQQDFKGDFGGRSMAGINIIGHDNFHKRFQYIWMDSWNSSMHLATGELGEDGKTITFRTQWKGPMGSFLNKDVYRIVDKNTYTIESWVDDPEKPVMHSEMRITRKGSKKGGFVAGCLENSGK